MASARVVFPVPGGPTSTTFRTSTAPAELCPFLAISPYLRGRQRLGKCAPGIGTVRGERADQPATTFPFWTSTVTAGSGFGAGPPRTAPGSALNFDPWHGQSSSAPLTATVHPMWVQIALKATALPALGWATMIGLPFASLAATAPPTGTLLSATRGFAEGAAPPDDAALDGAAREGAAADAGVGAAADVPDLPQAARVRAPAPRPTATSACRGLDMRGSRSE